MSENKKLSEKFLELLQHEGVVSVVSGFYRKELLARIIPTQKYGGRF